MIYDKFSKKHKKEIRKKEEKKLGMGGERQKII
jgi:hypothetical protein